MRVVFAAISGVALLSIVMPSAFASTVEAYAFTAMGESSCLTSGPTPQVANTIVLGGAFVPTPGAGCNVTQSLMDPTAAVGPLAATSSAAGASPTAFGAFSANGSSQSHADYNSFGVQALATLSGATDGLTSAGSEGYGAMNDGFTAPLSIGANGWIQFNYTFDGTQSLDGRGSALIELLWRKNLGPQFAAVRIQTSDSSPATLSINGEYVTTYPGITLGATSASANSALSFLVPASAGEHFALNLVFYGVARPGPSTGNPNPSSVTDDFISTVTLTSIVGLDSTQTPVSDPVLRDSAAAVPEPASSFPVAILMCAVFVRGCRDRGSRTGSQ